ncbi:MAG: hypothetical protein JNM85_02420 [Chthonomonas sp.]|nr:hypothetical protein [Chthonomonas sp.]
MKKLLFGAAVLLSMGGDAEAANCRDVYCTFYSGRSDFVATIYQDNRPVRSIVFYTYGSIEIRFKGMPVNHNYQIRFNDCYSWGSAATDTQFVHGYGWWGWELKAARAPR